MDTSYFRVVILRDGFVVVLNGSLGHALRIVSTVDSRVCFERRKSWALGTLHPAAKWEGHTPEEFLQLLRVVVYRGRLARAERQLGIQYGMPYYRDWLQACLDYSAEQLETEVALALLALPNLMVVTDHRELPAPGASGALT